MFLVSDTLVQCHLSDSFHLTEARYPLMLPGPAAFFLREENVGHVKGRTNKLSPHNYITLINLQIVTT